MLVFIHIFFSLFFLFFHRTRRYVYNFTALPIYPLAFYAFQVPQIHHIITVCESYEYSIQNTVVKCGVWIPVQITNIKPMDFFKSHTLQTIECEQITIYCWTKHILLFFFSSFYNHIVYCRRNTMKQTFQTNRKSNE